MASCFLARSIDLTSHLDDRGEGLTDKALEAKVTFARSKLEKMPF